MTRFAIEYGETQRQKQFVENPRYRDLVREGFCPECGRQALGQVVKGQYLIQCMMCGTHYTMERAA